MGEGRDPLRCATLSLLRHCIRITQFFIMSHYAHPNPYRATPLQHSSFAVLRSCQLNCPLITARVACLSCYCSLYAELSTLTLLC